MTLQIGLLLFPDVQQLDLTGPYEVFASLPDTAVHLVAATPAPVVSATRLVLLPTVTFEDCPRLDVLCVPGGVGVNRLLQDETVLGFVRRQAAGARFVSSVCTGALVLARPGCCRAGAPLPTGTRTTCSPPMARSRPGAGWCATARC